MIAMVIVVTLASAFTALAIMGDARRLNREYKRIQNEFKLCNELIHGYNER